MPADAQESPIGRYRLLSESDIDTSVYAHDPHNNSLVQAWDWKLNYWKFKKKWKKTN